MLRDAAQRDGCAVLVGCWMPAHAHLLLRTTAVQLWRSMGLIQGRFARDYNPRHRVVFTRAAWLVRELLESRDARVLGRLHQRLSRAHLLIVDELGQLERLRDHLIDKHKEVTKKTKTETPGSAPSPFYSKDRT